MSFLKWKVGLRGTSHPQTQTQTRTTYWFFGGVPKGGVAIASRPGWALSCQGMKMRYLANPWEFGDEIWCVLNGACARI